MICFMQGATGRSSISSDPEYGATAPGAGAAAGAAGTTRSAKSSGLYRRVFGGGHVAVR